MSSLEASMARNFGTSAGSVKATTKIMTATASKSTGDKETQDVLSQITRNLTKMRSTDTVTVKCHCYGEIRVLTIKKPANFEELVSVVKEAFNREMKIFYMLPNLEVRFPFSKNNVRFKTLIIFRLNKKRLLLCF